MADVLSTMRRKKTTLKKFFEDAGVSSLSDAKKHLQDLGYDLPDDRTLRDALPKKVHKPVVKKVEVTAPQRKRHQHNLKQLESVNHVKLLLKASS